MTAIILLGIGLDVAPHPTQTGPQFPHIMIVSTGNSDAISILIYFQSSSPYALITSHPDFIRQSADTLLQEAKRTPTLQPTPKNTSHFRR